MKITGQPLLLSIQVAKQLSLNLQEAGFLRRMAQHCVATHMTGWGACEQLIEALDAARVPEVTPGPIYDLFKPE